VRFIGLDLRDGAFALVGVPIWRYTFGEFQPFTKMFGARLAKTKYSMDDYRKKGSCGGLVFKAEDQRTMPVRGASRYIHMYACWPAPSWCNEVPVRAARRGADVEVESMDLDPKTEVGFYVSMFNIAQENAASGFLV
jgi:hypothetical protein